MNIAYICFYIIYAIYAPYLLKMKNIDISLQINYYNKLVLYKSFTSPRIKISEACELKFLQRIPIVTLLKFGKLNKKNHEKQDRLLLL